MKCRRASALGYRCLNVTVTVRVTSSLSVTSFSVNEECLWLEPVTLTSRRRSAPGRGIVRNSSPLRVPPARLGGLLKLLSSPT